MKGQKDYMNAKIYKLTSTVDDNFYIGSTCTSLVVRLCHHKHDAKSCKTNRKVCEWINDVGSENIKIILINDDFVCDNMDKLRREEDNYIQMYKHDENCMNSNRAYVSREEFKEQKKEYDKSYREDNKEMLLQKKKEDYEENKEHYLKYKREWYLKNKESVVKRGKTYYEENKDHLAEKMKKYKEANKEKISESQRKWYINKKEKSAKIMKAIDSNQV